MAVVHQVVERMGSGRLVVAFLHLAEANVVNDQQLDTCPSLEPTSKRTVSESGMQIVKQIDAPRIAHAKALLARAQAEGLQDVAFASTRFACNDDVIVPTDEVETSELLDERLVEFRLEVEVERLEGLTFLESTADDTVSDTLLEFMADLSAQNVLEQGGRAGTFLHRPGKLRIECGEGMG